MTRRCSPILSATRVTIMCCSARTGRSIWAASSRPTRSGRCAWAPLRRTAYSVATPADCSGCAVRGPRGDRGIRRRGGRRRPTARAAPSGDRAVTAAFDVVVAGAGHNSLVATAYLARAGLRCVVLEASQEIGGDTGSAELTVPGFRHDSCSTAHNLIQASPIIRDDELGLAEHGLEYLHPDPVVHVPFPDGAWLTMWRDEERTAAEFARFSVRDAAAYRRMMADYGQVAPVLSRRRYTPAGQGQTTGELLAGQPGGERWLRADAVSAWDVGRAAQGAGPGDREPRRRHCDGREGNGAGAGTRALRRRRDSRRGAVPGDAGRAVNDPRQAAGRDGARAGMGRGFPGRGAGVAAGCLHVRHALRDDPAAAISHRRRIHPAGGGGDAAVGGADAAPGDRLLRRADRR